MSRGWTRTPALWLTLLCLVTGILACGPAQAFSTDQVEDAVDSTNALPFKFADWRNILDACNSANISACIDDVDMMLNSENVDVPSFVPQLVNVYVDIQNGDWLQMAEDTSEAIVCAVLDALSDGLDPCGLYGDLESFLTTVGGAVGTALGPAVNNFVCENQIGGISCNQGLAPHYTDTVCVYAPGSWLPSQAPQCDQVECSPGMSVCEGGNGPCHCSYCPAGQALQNGVCGVCQSTGSYGNTNAFAAKFDGSSCYATGGTGTVTVKKCPAGQALDPNTNECKAACKIGAVTGSDGVCHACGGSTFAAYSSPVYPTYTSSMGTCQPCALGMQSKTGAACACPSGFGQANASAQCQMCPANTYANFGACSTCPDQYFSTPGSNACRPLACPPNAHAFNHQCILQPHMPPASGTGTASGGPAIIPLGCVAGTHKENGKCVQDGLSAAPESAPQLECPPLSHSNGKVCVGPRGKWFCPEGWTMREGVCAQ